MFNKNWFLHVACGRQWSRHSTKHHNFEGTKQFWGCEDIQVDETEYIQTRNSDDKDDLDELSQDYGDNASDTAEKWLELKL